MVDSPNVYFLRSFFLAAKSNTDKMKMLVREKNESLYIGVRDRPSVNSRSEFVGLGRCLLRVLLLREDRRFLRVLLLRVKLVEITFHKIVGGGSILETIWTVAIFLAIFLLKVLRWKKMDCWCCYSGTPVSRTRQYRSSNIRRCGGKNQQHPTQRQFWNLYLRYQ